MKKKLKLKDLQIDSFITNQNQNLKGGTSFDTPIINTLQVGCLISITCTIPPPPRKTIGQPCPSDWPCASNFPIGC